MIQRRDDAVDARNPRRQRCTFGVLCVGMLTAASCSTASLRRIELMPTPHVFKQQVFDPFMDSCVDPQQVSELLYVTDRRPARKDEKNKTPFYANARGHLLRAGTAKVRVDIGKLSWDEKKHKTLVRKRDEDLVLHVTGVSEMGVLHRTAKRVDRLQHGSKMPPDAEERLVQAVNRRLDLAGVKEIYIFVHGFRLVFEYPILVSAELWHYLGYEGVFMAYSWPSTPKLTAYASDVETAHLSARNLRMLLRLLAERTNAEAVHVVGFSAGTRLVSTALYQLALLNKHRQIEEVRQELRLGRVILVGSDMDRDVMMAYIEDGLASLTESLTIYVSNNDQALDASVWVFDRSRAGQDVFPATPEALEYMKHNPRLNIISASEAKGADTDNGHSYFRESPWVSSDVLMTLRYGLTPKERGLVLPKGSAVWSFPPDYIRRLRKAVLGKRQQTQFACQPPAAPR